MNPLLIPVVGELAGKVLDWLIASPATTVTAAEMGCMSNPARQAHGAGQVLIR